MPTKSQEESIPSSRYEIFAKGEEAASRDFVKEKIDASRRKPSRNGRVRLLQSTRTLGDFL